jgi:DNA gyrase subunit A
MGRATQGVKLINLKANDSIAAVAKVMHEDEDEVDEDALSNEIDSSQEENEETSSNEELDN